MDTIKSSTPPPPPSMNDLPEDLIANVLSFTSPQESCRLALVSSSFWSASISDAVWERFLPPDYLYLLSSSVSNPSWSSKKDLFRRLCHTPLLIDGGKRSFSLEKRSGKKCYMISSRDLDIVWGDTPRYWKWIPDPDTRFGEVAELVGVCWLEVKGTIATTMLSPATLYTAYLVFKSPLGVYGFDHQPVEVSVGLAGCEKNFVPAYLDAGIERRRRLQLVTIPRRVGGSARRVMTGFNNPPEEIISGGTSEDGGLYPKERRDGWFEVELGEFFTKEGEAGELEICIYEVKGGNWKGGLLVQGIEIRPKQSE